MHETSETDHRDFADAADACQGGNYCEWTHQLLDSCAWKQCMYVADMSLDKASHVTTTNFKGVQKYISTTCVEKEQKISKKNQ